jgi:hypothetical protein
MRKSAGYKRKKQGAGEFIGRFVAQFEKNP